MVLTTAATFLAGAACSRLRYAPTLPRQTRVTKSSTFWVRLPTPAETVSTASDGDATCLSKMAPNFDASVTRVPMAALSNAVTMLLFTIFI